jgi:hypothetical protein
MVNPSDKCRKSSFIHLLRNFFTWPCRGHGKNLDIQEIDEPAEIHFYSGIKEDYDYGFTSTVVAPHVYEEISEADKRNLPRPWPPFCQSSRRVLPLVEPYEIIPVPSFGSFSVDKDNLAALNAASFRIHSRLSDETLRHLFAEFLKEQLSKEEDQDSLETYGQSSDESGISVWSVRGQMKCLPSCNEGSMGQKDCMKGLDRDYAKPDCRSRPIPPKRTSSTKLPASTFGDLGRTARVKPGPVRQMNKLTFRNQVSETIHV